jgi:hypothetical protein
VISRRHLFIVLLFAGIILTVSGYVMMEQRGLLGVDGELWLEEDSILDPNSVRLAWGVRAPPDKHPDGWIFRISIKANESIWIRSMWYETNQVFYEWHGSTLEKTVTINVDEKTSDMEWAWNLQNPSPATVEIYKVQVSYSAFRQPFRLTGTAVVICGLIILAIAGAEFAQRRLRKRR